MKWVNSLAYGLRNLCALAVGLTLLFAAALANATPFTMTVPGTGQAVPTDYPQAGGVVIVMTGINGNVYYQFANPTGGFVGYQNSGTPTAFQGNPFTLYPSIPLNCGYRSCADYFGGSIARMDIRFTVFDGDTQVGGFDYNRVTLRMNGIDVANWSTVNTQITNNTGTTSTGTELGFGNNTLNTGWVSSTNATLLSSILSTGKTTTQAYDSTPNDNYWDFTQGGTLSNTGLQTIAPGYELDKTVVGGATTFTSVGQVINYRYVVSNIGSVDINNVSVIDNKIPSVICPSPSNLPRTATNATSPNSLTCTGTYTVTQADIDAGVLTNVARANGTPAFGSLGQLTDTVSLTTTRTNNMTLTKTASPTTFGAAGTTVTYAFTVQNTGNTTLSNVAVTDPKIPGLVCSFASVPPTAGSNTRTCSGIYTVKQSDVDAFALSGTLLANTATAAATGPDGAALNRTAGVTLPGPVAAPAMTVTKTAVQANYNAVGAVLQFNIVVRNTGNVTWPAAPTVTDPLAGAVSCPVGAVAPNATVNCTANYTITQANLDAGSITNVANASVSVGASTITGSGTVVVPAVRTQTLTILKRLKAGSPSPFTTVGQQLIYEYVLTNTGNVTLSAPAVTDNKVGVTCPVGSILPGASVTCESAAYAVTQTDLNAGSAVNTATGSATGPVGPVSSTQTSLTVPATQSRAMSIAKSAPSVLNLIAGNVLTYSYRVTNTGNVTLTNPITITDNKIGTNLACSSAPLLPTSQVTCTLNYTVTAGDVTTGFITNSASATSGATVSNTATATVAPNGAPGLTLVKAATTANYDQITDTLSYTFTISNTGQVNIRRAQEPITINDPKVTLSVCTQPATLFPVGSGSTPTSYTCTGTYSGLTQADLNAGQFTNTATASFSYNPSGAGAPLTVSSPSSTVVIPAAITPGVSLTKSSTSTYSNVGDSVLYSFAVTNLTEQSLATFVVTDPKISGVTCPAGPILRLGTATCTGTYRVTQADLDAGQIFNTATVVATSPLGQTATATDTETVLINPAAQTKSMVLTKAPSRLTYTSVGTIITYTMQVRNTGNLTLTNVLVTDAQLGLSCTIGAIAPGTTDSSCTARKTITQADFDAGSYTNIASVSAAGAATVTDDATLTGPARVASWTFNKVADGSFTAPGDVVTFNFSVTNTGNVTLTNLSIVDDFFTPDLVCPIGSLAPGATNVSCTGSYTVLQSDVNAGSITNTADLSGNGVAGAPIAGTAAEIVPGPAPAPAMTVTKTELGANGVFGAVGTTETFTFAVENTGNVTLSNISIADPLTGFTCAIAPLNPGAIATTCANAAALSTVYTITQADVDAGSLTNTVTATATPAAGTLPPASDTITLTGPAQLPALTVDKTSTGGANFAAVGNLITYSYLVTNSGNITLTNPITIADDKTTVSCPALPPTGLAPLATLTCTSGYTVTQLDLNAGSVVNLARASVTQSVVPSATYLSGIAAVTSPSDTVTVLAAQAPGIGITKRIKPTTATTFDAPTDTIVFEFLVTNTGNVTLSQPILVDDAPLGISNLACGTPPVAPGATVMCEATWTATQAAIDAGSFTNSATANTTFGAATVATLVPGTATALAVKTPELHMVKALDGITNNIFAAGETASYTYTITNIGNVTAVGPITVSDNLIPSVSCPAGDLPPNSPPMVCTGSYLITSVDLQLGSVTNVARADAILPGGGTFASAPASETIPIGADPTLAITKSADLTSFSSVGQIITYTYEITNTSPGSGGIRPAIDDATITVIDDKIAGPFSCVRDGQLLPIPTDVMVCTATYAVTQADLDRVALGGALDGYVTNNASASGVFAGTPIISPPTQVTVGAMSAPAIGVTKSVVNQTNSGQPAIAGDTLAYTITVINTGNTTLTGIVVTDDKVTGLSCPATTLQAAPDTPNTMDCTGTYVVTQTDIDAQILTNTAGASATSPQGEPVSATGTVDAILADPVPALFVEKTLAVGTPAAAYQSVGEVVNFVITVRNVGNVTLNNVVVDDQFGTPAASIGTCSVGTLAPTDQDSSCTFSHTITQADIDAGEITNKAVATSLPANPGATLVTSEDTLVGTGPLRAPAISVSKVADSTTFLTEGVTINYTYTLVNTGNVTLTSAPVLTDDKLGILTACDPFPVGGLLPLGELVCTASTVTTQADVDAGALTNVVNVTMPNPYPVGPATLTATATETVTAARTSAFTIVKTPSITSGAKVDDVITYTYTVENTGNVTLTDVTLTDAQTNATSTSNLSIQPSNVIATMLPGDVVDLTATYTVTQADIDAGADLTNHVSGTATSPSGTTSPIASDDVAVAVVAAAPSLLTLKTIGTPAPTGVVGTSVTWDVTVSNTGNVTLSPPVLTDVLKRNTGAVVTPAVVPAYESGDDDGNGILDVGEVWVYGASHVLTQLDIDAGGVTNSVTARSTSPLGASVSDVSDNDGIGASDPTVLVIAPAPAILGEKTITASTTTLGGTVRFAITAVNTGNVTLNFVDIASDSLRRADGSTLTPTTGPTFVSADLGSAAGTLKVGETATWSATYVLTQADIDAGGISNSARVAGSPPLGGTPVSDVTDNGNDTDGNTTSDATVLVIPAAPGLSLDKVLASGGPAFDAVGDVLGYRFTVTNTGNVTITNPISITDPLITAAGGTITCGAVPLAPLASLDCTGSYAVTQADIDAGSVVNVASATDGTTTSAGDGVTVPALKIPALGLVKTAVSITEGGATYPGTQSVHYVVGAVVRYEYKTTNTGNVTITTPISVSDNLIPVINCPAFPPAGIAPGSSYVCTADYTVTSVDVQLTSVTNIATATDGTTRSALTSETVPADGVPALAIDKTLVSGSGFAAVGYPLVYQFRVTNAGQVSFANPVTVTDTLLGAFACYTPDAGNPDLTPTETVTCSRTYLVTQADLDAGEVLNEAYAQTTFGPGNTPVTSVPDSVTTPATLTPSLAVTKSAATLPVTAVGQVLTYTIALENTGNQTLRNIVAEDLMLPGFLCEIAVLAPTEADSCSGTHVVTQADVDAGTVVNTATATGITPQGGSETGQDSLTVAMPAAAPSMTLTKSATPSPFGAVGSTVVYTFAVENTGNVTLSDVVVTDAIVTPAYGCTLATVAVGATDTTCTLSYVVTQADIDAGAITNNATATALDPFDTPTDAADTITTTGPARVPALEVTKTARPVATYLGTTLTYDVTVANTGNVTITGLSLVDTLSRADSSATALDTGLTYVSGDIGGDGIMGVGEVWAYVGTHELTQDDVNAGGLSNTVTASGFGPGAALVSDVSDDGDDTDGNTTGDPTVTPITAEPGIIAVKTVTQPGLAPGDEVVFSIAVTNTGNVDLSPTSVTDTLTRADGSAVSGTITGPTLVTVPITVGVLTPNEVWTYELRYVLTQDDIDAGGLSNTATATGTPPFGAAVSDVSDNGNGTDGNTTNDPTLMLIAPIPMLDVLKDITTPGAASGDEVVFSITVTNTGTVTLTSLALSDGLSRTDGTPIPVAAPVLISGTSPTRLEVGAVNVYELRYVLTQDDVDAGGLSNSATGLATAPSGAQVTDRSRDGDPNDGNDSNDPTILAIARAPGLDVLKVASTGGAAVGDEVVFFITVTNTGNLTLSNLVVIDTLSQADGTPLAGSALTFLTGTSQTSLAVGAANTYELRHVLTQSDIDAGGISNSALARTRLPNGSPLEDASRNGDPNDGNNSNDPTKVLIAAVETMTVTKVAGIPVRTGPTTYEIPFTITIANTGNVTQLDVVARDDLGAFAAPSMVIGVTTPLVAGFDGANAVNGGYDGLSDTSLLQVGTDMLPGSVGTIDFTATIDTSTGAPASPNTVTVQAARLAAGLAGLAYIIPPADPQIIATKSVTPTQASVGAVVTYTVTFTNNNTFIETNLTLADDLPAGIAFVPDSATWNGAATPQPTQSANRLRWTGVSLAPGETVTLTYQGRVAAGGTLTNRAYVLNAAGTLVSNIASATVRVAPEAVFDCGDVIGKVFDDLNRNGYQDGPLGQDANAILGQNVDGGTADAAPVGQAGDGEPGLPNVRVVTVDGSVITTDEFGRFHVPCALLPSSIGSNFTLKLDERSLPSGYRVTTENPRTLRLTDGTVTKMNFGASISNAVDVDLTAAAFVPGTAEPTDALRAGIGQLVTQLRDTPSVLRLSYYRQGDTRATAQARLDAVEALVRDRWRDTGRYRLLIERTIREVQ